MQIKLKLFLKIKVVPQFHIHNVPRTADKKQNFYPVNLPKHVIQSQSEKVFFYF